MSTPFEENKEIITEEEESFENSTIFSAPTEKNDKVKGPGLWKKALLAFLVLAILAGGIWAIVALVAELKPEEAETETVTEHFLLSRYVTEKESIVGEETVVTETMNYDLVSKVQVADSELTLNMYAKREGSANTVWLEDSIPEEYTSTASVGAIARSALGIKYIRIISEEIEEGVNYGFDKPTYTVNITPNEGEAFTLTVGKQSPDKSGYYVTLSDEKKVYLVKNSYVTDLEVADKMELTKAMRVAAFSSTEGSAEYYYQGVLSGFDYLYFTNSTLDKTYKFETVNGEGDYRYNTYLITEPVVRMANDIGIVPIVEMFSNGIDGQRLYSFTKTDEDLKKFGLNEPDVYAEMKAGKQKRTIIAKRQEDGSFAVVASDMDVIIKASAASITVANLNQKSIYSEFIFIETLGEVETITVQSGIVKHSFGIEAKPDEEKEGQYEITGVRINGAEATSPLEFQSYYQFLLGIKVLSYEQTDLSGKSPVATITIKKNDGKTIVIDYYEAKNGRYQAVVNGNQQGLISSSNFKNIVKYAENVAAGKGYNS